MDANRPNLKGQPDETLGKRLDARARADADVTAYTFLADGEEAEERLTYAELRTEALRIAKALTELSAPGDRVLLLLPPGLGFVRAFFGCVYAGLIAAPLPPVHAYMTLARLLPRLKSIAANARPSVIVTASSLDPLVSRIKSEAPEFSRFAWVNEDLAGGRDAPPARPASPLALLQYSSGSTANPKAVMLTHANVAANCMGLRRVFDLQEGSVIASWLPHDHDMGFISAFMQPLFGSPLVFMSPLHFAQKPLRWLRTISTSRATLAAAPDFALELCCARTTPEERAALDLAAWRVLMTGAEPVQARTLDRFASTFAVAGFRLDRISPAYGLAEATMLSTAVPPRGLPRVLTISRAGLAKGNVETAAGPEAREVVGCGQVLPEHDVVIVDPDSRRRLPAGRTGEIWISGPSVGEGYWGRPDISESTFRAGMVDDRSSQRYLRTGDIGFLDSGEVFITGRMKDTIIINGLNHHAEDIEQTVQDACNPGEIGTAVAFPDLDDRGEVLVVAVERGKRGDARPPSAVSEAIRSAVLAAHGIPIGRLLFLRPVGVPRTVNQKIQRQRAVAMYRSGEMEILEAFPA